MTDIVETARKIQDRIVRSGMDCLLYRNDEGELVTAPVAGRRAQKVMEEDFERVVGTYDDGVLLRWLVEDISR